MVRSLSLKDISTLCNGMQYAQGFRHVKDGDVVTPWVGNRTIGGQIHNPVKPYTVRVRFDDDQLLPACNCSNHPRQRFCPHVVALLIAWATNPSSFARYNGPDTAPLAKGASPTSKAQDPRVAFRVALDRVEGLLLDLLTHGLLTFNKGRAQLIRETAHMAKTYGLGLIADALTELNEQVSLLSPTPKRTSGKSQHEFDEARYADALNTAWHLTQAAKLALKRDDTAALREIAAPGLVNEPGISLESAELVQLVHRTAPDRNMSPAGSYLLELGSGQLLFERPVTSRGRLPRQSKASYEWTMQGRVTIFPASDVDEVVLLDVERGDAPGPEVWERAYAWAETSAGALVGRLREVVADLPGSDRAHVWFAPSRVAVRSDGVSFLDEQGVALGVEPAQAIERVLLDVPILAAFGSVARSEEGLRFAALSLLTGGDAPALVSLSG